MKQRITHIDPWQCAKTFALVYFAVGLVLALPLGLISAYAPVDPDEQRPGVLFFVFMPVLYAIAALIFVPIGCWLYNKAARYTGGFEMTVEER